MIYRILHRCHPWVTIDQRLSLILNREPTIIKKCLVPILSLPRNNLICRLIKQISLLVYRLIHALVACSPRIHYLRPYLPSLTPNTVFLVHLVQDARWRWRLWKWRLYCSLKWWRVVRWLLVVRGLTDEGGLLLIRRHSHLGFRGFKVLLRSSLYRTWQVHWLFHAFRILVLDFSLLLIEFGVVTGRRYIDIRRLMLDWTWS